MQVEYEYDADSIRAIYRAYPLSYRCWLHLGPAVYALLITSPSFLYMFMAGLVQPAFYALAAGAVLIFYLTIKQIYRIRTHLKQEPPEGKFVTIQTENYIEAASEYNAARVDWSTISHAVELAQHFIIFLRKDRGLCIPYSAFTSDEQRSEFIRFTKQQIEKSKNASHDCLDYAQYLSEFKPEWAGDLKQSIEVHNTKEQWGRAEVFGIGKEQIKKSPSIANFVRTLVKTFTLLGLFLVFMMFSTAESDIEGRQVLIALVSIPFLSFMLIPFIINWIRLANHTRHVPNHYCESKELRIYRDCFLSVSGTGISWMKWTHVGNFANDGELIAMYAKDPRVLLLIPIDTFENLESAIEFAELLATCCQHGQESGEEEDITLVIAEETGNPYQAPLQD